MSATNPGGRLWVNPDGVEGLGNTYDSHVELYENYLGQLTSLRARYAKAWGDDDMGQQFSTKFLQGLDNLEAIIGGVKGTLKYTAEGLREGGKAYREADEAAAEVGTKMARDFDDLEKPLFKSARHAVEGKLLEPTESTPQVFAAQRVEGRRLEPMKSARLAVEGKHLEPTESGHLVQGRLIEPAVESRRLVEGRRLEPMKTARHAVEGERVEATPRLRAAVRTRATPAMPAMPAISSYSARPEFSTAYVGGRPLPEGYQLIALNPFEDGTTRVDANLYDSVTPLAGAPVTHPDGTPVDGGPGQFFVVKQNPAVDPTVPGYQPLILSYAPDGTPTPIFVGP